MTIHWNSVIGKSEISELIISNDKSVRAAKVDVTSNDRMTTLKKPINKLFPAEFSNQHTIDPTFVNEKNVPQVVIGGSVPQEWTLHMVSSGTWLFM